ncbi:hypothetical protein STENM327S_00908 [Streptomyces tendae]
MALGTILRFWGTRTLVFRSGAAPGAGAGHGCRRPDGIMERDERGQGRIMDWLKKLPLVGPWIARLMTTHAWRSYKRLDRVKWSRLAAAMTFTSFVALFPLLSLAAAVAAATLSRQQQDKLQDKLAEQIPGISDQLNIQGLVDNAGTVGVISALLLLFTAWAGSRPPGTVCGPCGSCPTRRRTRPAPGQGRGRPGRPRRRAADHRRHLHRRLGTGRLDHPHHRPRPGRRRRRPALRRRLRRRRARRLPAAAVRADPAARRPARAPPPGGGRADRRGRLRTAETAAQRLHPGRRGEEHVRRLRRPRRPAAVDQLHREAGAVCAAWTATGSKAQELGDEGVTDGSGDGPGRAAATSG